MLLIFFVSFYLAEGGDLSVRGSDVRVDIFTYYFVYLEYFPILLIYLESLFYRLSFDIIFA